MKDFNELPDTVKQAQHIILSRIALMITEGHHAEQEAGPQQQHCQEGVHHRGLAEWPTDILLMLQ